MWRLALPLVALLATPEKHHDWAMQRAGTSWRSTFAASCLGGHSRTLAHLALLDPGAFRALEILVGALTFSWLNRRRNSRIVGVVEDYAIAAAALIGTFVGGGSLDSLIAGAVLGFFACLSGALALMRRRKVAPGPH